MWINTAESVVMGNDSDDDSNGYTDDWIGWDFVTGVTGGGGYTQISGEDYDVADNDPSDFNGHGTHCAGNISAINNNGYASASAAGGWGDGTLQAMANGVRVMALRIGYSMQYLGQERGLVQMDFAAEALYYAANNGARIVSCSWGSSDTGGIADAIDYFLASGGLIFKSAGNSGISTADYICGRGDDNIICVAATDSFDLKADFSNYGSWVDISAPGVDILSSYHVHTDPQNDYVATVSGTSMATPIAASTAALIWGANPNLTADVVRQILFNNTDDIDGLNPGYEGLLGVGRVNAHTPLLDTSLPVELGTFTAGWDSGVVRLEWETFSELENLGFEICRRTGEEGTYQMISSFREEESLIGLGNSSTGRSYYYIDNDARSGFLYSYVLYDVDYSGISTAHGPVVIDLQNKYHDWYLAGNQSDEYMLNSNYPNPFNPLTRIDYQLPGSSVVNLSIYNLQGQKIATLVSEVQNAGHYQVEWDASQFASGVYFYKIEVADPANLQNEFRDIKKMILLK